MKMDRLVLDGKLPFRMLWLTFSSKVDWGSYIISIPKTAFNKIGALIRFVKILSREVALYLHKFTMQPCMNTVVIFGLVLLLATWNC